MLRCLKSSLSLTNEIGYIEKYLAVFVTLKLLGMVEVVGNQMKLASNIVS